MQTLHWANEEVQHLVYVGSTSLLNEVVNEVHVVSEWLMGNEVVATLFLENLSGREHSCMYTGASNAIDSFSAWWIHDLAAWQGLAPGTDS